MNCKTCNSSLRSDFRFCPHCGAKVIRNRLTLKNIWQDVSVHVFDLDNTFLKTFRHLFHKPDVVINSFISGVRKKYMNPIGYFAIAITSSGILFYILRNWYGVDFTGNDLNQEVSTKMDFIFDFQGILSYLFIPVYAAMTWLLFLDTKKLNYTEHLIANTYTTAQTYLVQFLICLPLFSFFEITYQDLNWWILLLSTIYQFYAFQKLHHVSNISAILRALGYLMMFSLFLMGIGILFVVIGKLTGNVEWEDIRPK